MIETSNPELNVDELMKRVRAEAAKKQYRGGESPIRAATAIGLPEPRRMPAPPAAPSLPPVDPKKQRLEERLLLAREKTEVSRSVPKFLRGLFRRQGAFNGIVLETLSSLVKTVASLTNRARDLNTALEAQAGWLREVAHQRATDFSWTRTAIELAGRRAEEADERVAAHVRNLQAQVDTIPVLRAEFEEKLRRLEQMACRLEGTLIRMEERATSDGAYMKGELARQRSALARTSLPQLPSDNEVGRLARTTEAGRLDAFYIAFEDRFRGSRTEIKERVRIYLPDLEAAGAGTAERPVLDLGCGRGEWLELLGEGNFVARGVDMNSAMIAQCAARGLEGITADAIDYLRAQPEASLGAVTGFHIIEHLPFELLLDLFAETNRVLLPGGIALFESPNCKNLVVGACNFYSDPTHRNPVFPDTAAFMLDLSGFQSVEVKYISAAGASPFNTATPDGVALDNWFYGPRDFAVIGRKP